MNRSIALSSSWLKVLVVVPVLFATGFFEGRAQSVVDSLTPPKVLIVIAHPDDESSCAGAVYKLTHDLNGEVDLALITNGEGGYKYSTLGNEYYGLDLTDEEIGRAHLPTIRKKELMAGGDIIGIRNYFFLDQQDHRYTLDADSTLGYVWDTTLVVNRLVEIMRKGEYDYVFGLLPTPGTHGHHKSTTMLALHAALRLEENKRPIVLGTSGRGKDDTTRTYFGLEDYPITSIASGRPAFTFDRTQKFGYKNRLDYQIVVNWLIAEHKSQGTMQLAMYRGELEEYWWFDANGEKGKEETEELFNALHVNRYPTLKY